MKRPAQLDNKLNHMNKLPIFKMMVEDTEDGVSAVALVEFPAIEKNFLKFSKGKGTIKFKIEDEDRRIVSGPLLIPDMPIYRKEGDYEYYVLIEKEQVLKAAQRFFKEGNHDKTNSEHTTNFFDGVVMFESFIIDSSRGIKAPEGYGELAEGSWFGSFIVENDEVWQAIKDDTYLGFSIEGLFSFKEIVVTKAQTKTPVQDLLENITELQKLL